MSSDSRLSIDRIYGTSSNNQLNFAVSANLVAYIASGGVVVAPIDKSTGTLSPHQRFFCAYNTNAQVSSTSSANSYLNMIQNQQPVEEKDQYGQPKLQSPVTISNNSDVSNQLGDLSLGSSPPKQTQKIKTISCVAISPDEKLLAVGETGSQPRILIFSLAPDSNDYPILSLSEHNFGILALKFSPNSKYLLSVGVNHDSFIYLWRLNGANTTIVGANRCTSQINGLLWVDQYIITYGIRHIKVWKYEEFESKSMIEGKSVMLGDFLNGNFVYATGDDIDEVLFLSSLGEIFQYDSSRNVLSLRYKFNDSDDKVGAIFRDSFNNKVWVGSQGIQPLDSASLQLEISKDAEKSPESPTKVKFQSHITAINQISEKHLVFLTSSEEIQLFDIANAESKHLIDSLSKSITGVKRASTGKIVSWTKSGVIKFFDEESLNIEYFSTVDIEELPNKVISNHVTALEITKDENVIIGDAYGNLSIFEKSGKVVFNTPTHEFTINDICYFTLESFEIIVSIGRDRMIQVFAKRMNDENTDPAHISEIGYEWSIFQTLDDHKGNLLKLIYQDSKIFVSSADRSISVHKFYVSENELMIEKGKTISLKSSPLAMAFHREDLVVSTNDKTITVYNGTSLESVRSFKVYDNENESLLVDNLQITQDNLLVCSCSDKSIRTFNYLNSKQTSVNWGHSEAIRELVLISSSHLITLSNNGCLFTWSLYNRSANTQDNATNTIQKYNDFSTPPKVTRKIKKPVTSTPLSRKQLSPSLVRSPATSRLQSTARLTPSKLTNSTKTNLSPSTPKSSPRQSSPKPVHSPSTPTTVRHNLRSSIVVNNKTRLSELSESKVTPEDLVYYLKNFKENIESYTPGQVQAVKKEINGLFEYEDQLLEKYNKQVMEKINEMLKK